MVEERNAYELCYVNWGGPFDMNRLGEDEGETVRIQERHYNEAWRQIRENGSKTPPQSGHDKMMLQDDDYLYEGCLFRFNPPSQVMSGGGPRTIRMFIGSGSTYPKGTIKELNLPPSKRFG